MDHHQDLITCSTSSSGSTDTTQSLLKSAAFHQTVAAAALTGAPAAPAHISALAYISTCRHQLMHTSALAAAALTAAPAAPACMHEKASNSCSNTRVYDLSPCSCCPDRHPSIFCVPSKKAAKYLQTKSSGWEHHRQPAQLLAGHAYAAGRRLQTSGPAATNISWTLQMS
eukprot:1154438-Pelagomonas_calceolata.AAC.1